LFQLNYFFQACPEFGLREFDSMLVKG